MAVTLEDFQDRTALLPHVIADAVSGGNPAFAEYVATRTLHLYDVNAHFRRKLQGVSGREWLYAFVDHWHKGYQP